MINIVTSFDIKKYELYGKQFISAFNWYWPKENVKLYIYVEGYNHLPILDKLKNNNIVVLDLLKESSECVDFLKRHKNDGYVKGIKPHASHAWKEKPLERRYNYRYDAYKFCRKVFAMKAALKYKSDKLFWIDADCIIFKRIPIELLETVMPSDKAMSHLARKENYTETGFIGYNCKRPEAISMIEELANIYESDEFFKYGEWNDAYLWDVARDKLGFKDEVYAIPSNMDNQPFESSPLGSYMMHLKGARKDGIERFIKKRAKRNKKAKKRKIKKERNNEES